MKLWKKICVYAGFAVIAEAAPLGLPDVPVPADNPQTEAKIKLGDVLFHDPRFSADGKVSCATCHAREKAFTDHLSVSKGFTDKDGTRVGTRNAPTVINSAYYTSQFWDGRVASLEEQSKLPPINPVEGGLHSWKDLVDMLKKDAYYKQEFKKVFGVKPSEISIEHFSKAIASFERTVISGNSKFDRYMYGGDKNALNEQEKRGLKIYLGQGRCVSCHVISQTQALFTDNRFYNIGVGFKSLQGKTAEVASEYIKILAQQKEQVGKNKKNLASDELILAEKKFSELGRFVVTNEVDEIGAFKTPSLRNIEKTWPYMHDGSLSTLEEVVAFYNFGGKLNPDAPDSPFLDGGIRPLHLNGEQMADLVAFLKALTSSEFENVKDEK
ncbi:cytochrome-c peroxidase [Sulfurimonas sediminis]|uniref:Cytochrome-c peroxidase n=1 Tax=Sulfurimonas sediminis TaxID=2590020 RepID=A0A7M1B482_9BACT|nr:cytochrome c peroxidase [Sulfurimonas sediminis]QOP44533.1 cytochrome-c peroxidase [Sulfurimonas sediminis]